MFYKQKKCRQETIELAGQQKPETIDLAGWQQQETIALVGLQQETIAERNCVHYDIKESEKKLANNKIYLCNTKRNVFLQ